MRLKGKVVEELDWLVRLDVQKKERLSIWQREIWSVQRRVHKS